MNQSCSRVGEESDMFPIMDGLQQGNVSSQLLFTLAVEYTGKQGRLEVNGTHQFLFYADDGNILDGRVHTINKDKEHLIVISK